MTTIKQYLPHETPIQEYIDQYIGLILSLEVQRLWDRNNGTNWLERSRGCAAKLWETFDDETRTDCLAQLEERKAARAAGAKKQSEEAARVMAQAETAATKLAVARDYEASLYMHGCVKPERSWLSRFFFGRRA